MTEKTSNISYGKASVPATTGSNQLSFKTSTGLGKAQEYYMKELGKTVESQNIQLDAEQTVCGMNMVAAMFNTAKEENKRLGEYDQNEIGIILQQVTALRLNIGALPRQCYLINRRKKMADGTYSNHFEFGVEGTGNEKLVREYAVGIKKLHPCWVVREHDVFTYPSFNGLEITPPTWQPKDYYGKVVRVVYPVEYEDGRIEFAIAEREGVKKNIIAQINQSIMWDKDYPSKEAKQKFLERLDGLTLEEIFKDQEALKKMNPSYALPFSREGMLLTKMKNNILKPIPKDFASSYERELFETIDEAPRDARIDAEQALEAEVEQHSNTEQIERPVQFDEATGEVISEPTEEPKKETRATTKKTTVKAAPTAEAVQEITSDDCPF